MHRRRRRMSRLSYYVLGLVVAGMHSVAIDAFGNPWWLSLLALVAIAAGAAAARGADRSNARLARALVADARAHRARATAADR